MPPHLSLREIATGLMRANAAPDKAARGQAVAGAGGGRDEVTTPACHPNDGNCEKEVSVSRWRRGEKGKEGRAKRRAPLPLPALSSIPCPPPSVVRRLSTCVRLMTYCQIGRVGEGVRVVRRQGQGAGTARLTDSTAATRGTITTIIWMEQKLALNWRECGNAWRGREQKAVGIAVRSRGS